MSYIPEKALRTVILTIVAFMGFGAYSVHGSPEEVKQPTVEENSVLVCEFRGWEVPLETASLDRIQRKITNDIILSTKSPEVVPREFPRDTSCEAYRKIIEQYDWPVELAMSVCAAESWGKVDNVNEEHHKDGGCYGSVGLFQIACVHGFTVEEMSDPHKNVAYAYSLWSRRGWNPWGVCHDGKVDCGL
jgi:hypothetical protein